MVFRSYMCVSSGVGTFLLLLLLLFFLVETLSGRQDLFQECDYTYCRCVTQTEDRLSASPSGPRNMSWFLFFLHSFLGNGLNYQCVCFSSPRVGKAEFLGLLVLYPSVEASQEHCVATISEDLIVPILPVNHCLFQNWVLNFGHKFATIGASCPLQREFQSIFLATWAFLSLMPFSTNLILCTFVSSLSWK